MDELEGSYSPVHGAFPQQEIVYSFIVYIKLPPGKERYHPSGVLYGNLKK